MATNDAPALHPVRLTPEERHKLGHLRVKRRKKRVEPPLTPGEKVADAVAATMGSWRFIIIQSTLLAVWIALNIIGWARAWDPYPFILLNLALSFQAAYAAPFIMMSQNRQAQIDRARAMDDYDVNVKAELEIELLHQKIDMLREQEVAQLTCIIEELVTKIDGSGTRPAPGA